MSLDRKNKRARQCRDDDESPDELQLPPPLLSVVRVLSQNGHIGPTELGRIGTTCSSLRRASLDEEAWAGLCRRRWANTDRVPRSVIETCGYRWLYRRKAAGIPEAAVEEEDANADAENDEGDAPPPPPPPARCTHENLVALVDMTVDGVSFISEAYAGEALRPLLESGSLPLPFDRPVPLGKVGNYGVIKDYSEAGSPKFHATVHVLDLTTNKCACLMDACNFTSDWYSPEDADDSPTFAYGTEGDDEYLSSHSSRAPPNAADKFKYRFDGPGVYIGPDEFCECVPLGSATRALAERAMPKELDGGFEGLYFELEACQLRTDNLEKFLGFDHVFSKFKESLLFDPNQPIAYAALANFEKDYWDKYLENNSFDPKLSGVVKEAEEMRARFGSDTAFVSIDALVARRVEVGGNSSGLFYGPGYGRVRSFNGVTLHHLIDGLQGWDSD